MRLILFLAGVFALFLAFRSSKPGWRTYRLQPPQPSAPTSDEIALRAYVLAQERQARGHHGDPVQDWIEAERQLSRVRS